jgi:hypothetical protein
MASAAANPNATAATANASALPHNHDLALYARLDQQLLELVESFTNLVRAARGPDDEQVLAGLVEGVGAGAGGGGASEGGGAGGGAAARASAAASSASRAPGELPEVLAERLLAAGHACVEAVAELKRAAVLSDFDALVALVRARRAGLEAGAQQADAALAACSAEAAALLRDLEEHYYGSSHPGALPAFPRDAAAERLAALATRRAGGGGGGGGRGDRVEEEAEDEDGAAAAGGRGGGRDKQ